jgi:hypothetical protein
MRQPVSRPLPLWGCKLNTSHATHSSMPPSNYRTQSILLALCWHSAPTGQTSANALAPNSRVEGLPHSEVLALTPVRTGKPVALACLGVEAASLGLAWVRSVV